MIIEARDDVVRLEGALEKNLWPTIQAAANLLLRQHVGGIIIDASGMLRCSPEGAKTFIDAMNYIERYHARIVVAAIPTNVMDCVRTVPGVRSRLPISSTIEEARASLKLDISRRGHLPAGARQLENILVPLFGSMPVETATLLACRLARADTKFPTIHLVYVLEVPRVLTLNAPLPEDEANAARAIAQAEALVRQEGLRSVTHVIRGRDTGEGIVHQAQEIGANIIVSAYHSVSEAEGDPMPRIIRTLLQRAPCEVILNRLPATTVVKPLPLQDAQ